MSKRSEKLLLEDIIESIERIRLIQKACHIKILLRITKRLMPL